MLGWPWSEGTQRTAFNFASAALAEATGALIAAGAIYLLAVAAGVFAAATAPVIAAVVGVVIGALGAFAVAKRPALLRRRAARLLDEDAIALSERLKRLPFVPSFAPDAGVIEALNRLPERERTVLTLRFGGPMTLQDIGEGLGLTRQRVRQIEAQALARLAEQLGGDTSLRPEQ